jgi:fumarylacetoacetase
MQSSSWVPGADAHRHFSSANIPFGIVSHAHGATPRVATAIGDHVLDLLILAEAGHFDDAELGFDVRAVFGSPTLNAFAALPLGQRRATRAFLQDCLAATTAHGVALSRNGDLVASALLPAAAVVTHLPFAIGGSTQCH